VVDGIRSHSTLGEIVCFGEPLSNSGQNVFEMQRWRAATSREWLAERYADTRNPLFAWLAIQESLLVDLPLPHFAREYLLAAARELVQFTYQPPKNIRKAVTSALRLEAAGPLNPFAQVWRLNHEILIAFQVRQYQTRHQAPEMDLNSVFHDVAREHVDTCIDCEGVGAGKVKQVWYRHRHLFQ
jgi:hypothetical protein